jgi:hypothetical protein
VQQPVVMLQQVLAQPPLPLPVLLLLLLLL